MTTVTNAQVETKGRPIGQPEIDAFLREIARIAPWETWAEKLAMRKHPLPLQKLIPTAKVCPLFWSTTSTTRQETRKLLEWLASLRRRRHKREAPSDWNALVTEWLDDHRQQSTTVDDALCCLAWAHAMPRLALRTEAEVWAALFAKLVNEAIDVSTVDLDDASADQILLSQLMGTELPLTMAYSFPKIELCEGLAENGRRNLNEGLIELLDGEGIPHARVDGAWAALLGCWTRATYLDRKLKGTRVDKDARLQFEWLVRQSIRWSRSDGSLLLGDPFTDCRGLIEAALEAGGDQVDRELAMIQRGALSEDDSEYALPPAGEHSEWAEVALLRSDWSRRGIALAVNYGVQPLANELQVGGTTVWMGDMEPVISVDGQRLKTSGSWEQVCWFADDDVDYLELELTLQDGWRVQRQYLLAREEEFLFLADALIGTKPGSVEYRLEMPTEAPLDWIAEEQHTELQMVASKPLGWAMPLALCEWNSDRRAGVYDGNSLTMTRHGSALYAPIFYDLAPSRRRKPRTWRQLTVAESLEILPADVAVAYRVQSGSQQWAFYRSLGPAGNRTFLGQNITSEFVAGRFDEEGELDSLIEIE